MNIPPPAEITVNDAVGLFKQLVDAAIQKGGFFKATEEVVMFHNAVARLGVLAQQVIAEVKEDIGDLKKVASAGS